MISPVDELFEKHSIDIKIIECFGIADSKTDALVEFARKCCSTTFSLTEEQCREIVHKHGELLQMRGISPWLMISQSSKEPIEVQYVRRIWDLVVPTIKNEFQKALFVEAMIKSMSGSNPVDMIEEKVSERFDGGSQNQKNELKNILLWLNTERNNILAGIAQFTALLGKDSVMYAREVAIACVSTVPQKGLQFAIALLANAGGSNKDYGRAFEVNLRGFLDGTLQPGRGVITSQVNRLSETKTVLVALQLAKARKGRHFELPTFNPIVESFLRGLLK